MSVVQIKPKSESGMHSGQRYICSYDPNAPTENAWVWRVMFTRTYNYVGSAPTQVLASRAAKRKIIALNKSSQDTEERGA